MLNAVNMPLRGGAVNFVRLILLYIPLAWIGSQLFGLSGIFFGVVAANAIAGTGAALYLRHILRQRRRGQGPPPQRMEWSDSVDLAAVEEEAD
jgi:Na+-driven multidrug efflux pump